MHKYSPKRIHPGSARLPIASFSIMSRNSSSRSGLISASTTMAKGLDLSAVVVEEDIWIFLALKLFWKWFAGAKALQWRGDNSARMRMETTVKVKLKGIFIILQWFDSLVWHVVALSSSEDADWTCKRRQMMMMWRRKRDPKPKTADGNRLPFLMNCKKEISVR